MKLKLGFLAICLTIASFWGSAEAVKCYQCTSATNPSCGENFKPENGLSFDCTNAAPMRWLANALGTNRNATGCMKFVKTTNGIQCWTCDSRTNKNCGEDFVPNNITNRDCNDYLRTRPQSFTDILMGCMKITQQINGVTNITRSCYFGKYLMADECTHYNPDDYMGPGNLFRCDICNNNLCNSSPPSFPLHGRPPLTLLLFIMTIVAFVNLFGLNCDITLG